MEVKDLIVTGDARILGDLQVGKGNKDSVDYSYGTTDIGTGAYLETGKLYFVYE